MIRYQLRCAEGHGFEAWFKDSKAYDKQASKGIVECPMCGSTSVEKAIMAPAVPKKGNTKGANRDYLPAPAPNPEAEARATEVAKEILQAMGKLRDHVEQHCENVGEKFPEEARKMHYGEAEERGIFGDATLEEAKELHDEGITVMPLPGRPDQKN
ncbi:MAG: DUF1178 family protein [Magnetovibrionaceae bacterium]